MRLAVSVFAALICFQAIGYSLFNPKPDGQLRPLSTDRPDKAESPYTVDAGHFQVESEIYAVAKDEKGTGGGKTKTTTTNINNINLKAGLTENSDFQLVIPSYVKTTVDQNGEETEASGTGDITARYKHNIFGNEGGDVAFGIMPYIKAPTAKAELSNGEYEGGVMFPFAFALPDDWDMGVMLTLDNRYNEKGEDRRTDYIMTWAFGRRIVGDLGGFFEFYTQTSDDRGFRAVSTFDFGLTYMISPRVQLDAGAFIGMTEAAEDVVGFGGVSALF